MSKKDKNKCDAVNSKKSTPFDISNTAMSEYFDIVKGEYEIERNKKQSFENRSGLLLALLGALCIFLFEYIKFSDIISLLNKYLTFITLLKIISGIVIYVSFCFTFFSIIKTINAKRHHNFEVKSINESYLVENRKDALARLILTYREIILQHRSLNEKRSKWYVASLYSMFILLISTIIYISI